MCHLSAEAKRVTAVKCNVPNCPMPIVPPAAISPHDTWFGKSLGKLGLAPPIPVAREKIVEGKCGIIKTFVMVFVVGRGDKPTSWNHIGTSSYWLFGFRSSTYKVQTLPFHLESPMYSPRTFFKKRFFNFTATRKATRSPTQDNSFFFVTDVNLCVFFFRVSIWGNLNSVQWMF